MRADLRVVGVGGGGSNALSELRRVGHPGVGLLSANTDAQALSKQVDTDTLQLGPAATRGLGAGGRPSVGLAAARESTAGLQSWLSGADMVFIAAGLGGGTGTGAAPVVGQVARELGALTVGVVTLPFGFEGSRRANLAQQGLKALRDQVDSLLVVPNERLLAGPDATLHEAFAQADQVLADAVRGIADLVVRPGLINLDFADVRAVLSGGGRAVMGIGVGRGERRAEAAVEGASRSPLIDVSLRGATGVLLQFTVDPAVGLHAIHRAAALIEAHLDDDAELFFGVTVDANLDSEVHVTLTAAGLSFDERPPLPPTAHAARAYLTSAEVVLSRPRRNALVMLRDRR